MSSFDHLAQGVAARTCVVVAPELAPPPPDLLTHAAGRASFDLVAQPLAVLGLPRRAA